VGTDSHRRRAMHSLEQLNHLRISGDYGINVREQSGYVPPPLVGIWARWPYLHNNSVPNLCALLTAGPERASTYWSGEARDPQTDFDFECNGYPLGPKTPPAWRADRAHFFDSARQGLSNRGHDEGIFLHNGRDLLSAADKRDLIRFLQTL